MSSRIEHMLRGFFNHIGFGLLVTDHALRVLFWNDMIERQSGLNLATHLGQPITTVFPDSDHATLKKMATEAIANDWPVYSHWRQSPLLVGDPILNPKYNSPRLESSMVFAFNDTNGQPLLGFVQYDATDIARSYEKLNDARNQLAIRELEQEELIISLKQANMQLVQSEKMAAIGQLAAGVAHEINNPISFVMSNINALSGYVTDVLHLINAVEDKLDIQRLQQLKDSIDFGMIRDDIQDLLQESTEGISRVRKIIQSLKEFSHQGSNEFALADLNTAIRNSLNLVHNEIKYKAELIVELGDLPQVECILSEINQVLVNLLVNAAQAIDQQGVITVRSGSVGKKVWINIEDTGCGMDNATQKRIFEPFFTTKEVGTGTGLGLSLSYNIVQKHGGRIEVISEPGAGTCFHLELPVLQPNEHKEVSYVSQ